MQKWNCQLSNRLSLSGASLSPEELKSCWWEIMSLMSVCMLARLKPPSDIILPDMLKGMSGMMGLVSGYWSWLRDPVMGRGCSMPGTRPGWGGMNPM